MATELAPLPKPRQPPRSKLIGAVRAGARGLLLGMLIGFHGSALEGANLPAGFSEFVVASGLSRPTAMEFAPDGRLFVCQQDGELRVIKNLSLLPGSFLTVTTDGSGERGLLGIAFDPGFATNKYLYIYYTATTPSTHNRVSRFTANGDVAVAGSELPILDLENLGPSNHNGGAIHFGVDGRLYVAVGENASSGNAQSLANRLGKLLRINRDGSIPTNNPFYATASDDNRAIWALGLRNPYTFAVQPGTGRIFINDVGEGTWEEINEGVAGANYGWPFCEGRCVPHSATYRDPVFQYAHGNNPTNGCDITGGAFYNPIAAQYPATYLGTYFFSDACGGWIRRLTPETSAAFDFAANADGPVDVKVSAEGRLFYLARNSEQVRAIDYTNTPPRLGLGRVGPEIILLWPAPSSSFVLQSSTSASPGSWMPASLPVTTTNGQNRVSLSPTGSSRFFRLSRM